MNHYWDDIVDEIPFASSDLSSAYRELLMVPLTALTVCDAKARMDEAVERALRALALAADDLRAKRRVA
jgi:hypothetical protein